MTAEKVVALIDLFLEELKAKEAFRRLETWRVLMDHRGELRRRDPGRWRPLFEFWQCARCDHWHSAEDVPRCVVCGLDRTAQDGGGGT